MADIRRFRAVRPIPEKAAKIAALPYDVYNRKEAAEIVKRNPDSFLAIDRAETSFDESVDTYDERVYIRAKELLEERIAAGDFVTEEVPMYYIYALTMEGRTQHGFVACASIDDYEDQVIKKHENTREDKEKDRIHLQCPDRSYLFSLQADSGAPGDHAEKDGGEDALRLGFRRRYQASGMAGGGCGEPAGNQGGV